MLALTDKWAPVLISQPETGMGYQIVSVTLRDGRQIDQVMIVGGIVTEIAGQKEIPFTEDQIVDIRVTHGK
jgi:hypothetical protein